MNNYLGIKPTKTSYVELTISVSKYDKLYTDTQFEITECGYRLELGMVQFI